MNKGLMFINPKNIITLSRMIVLCCVLMLAAPISIQAEEASAANLYQQANKALHAGDLDQAVGLYRRYIKLKPNDHRGYGSLGWALILEGKYKEAKAPTIKATELDPANIAWKLNLGHIYLFDGDEKTAKTYYGRGLELIRHENEYSNGIVADFKLFIKKGWHVETCKRLLIWVEKANKKYLKAQHLSDQAWKYYQAKEYAKASQSYELALKEYEHALGTQHLRVAIALHDLAKPYMKMHKFSKVEPLLQRTVAIREEILGTKHISAVKARKNLADLYFDWGKSLNKKKLYKDAIARFRQAQGIDKKYQPLDYAYAYGWIADCYASMNQFDEAVKARQMNVAGIKHEKGEDHPSYATSLNNLAGLYYKMGEYGKALPLYTQALAIKKKVFGENHPTYATSLNNLAMLYTSMGSYAKALPLYEQVSEVFKKRKGEDHPSYATSLNNLAGLYKTMGEYGKALPLSKQALAIRKKALGEDHPDYAASLNNLAGLYGSMGEYGKALPLYEQALAIDKKVLGGDHPSYAQILANLAKLYVEMGKSKEALPLLQQGLSIAMNARDPTLLFHIQSRLSTVLKEQYHPESAIFFGKQAVNTLQSMRTMQEDLDKGLKKSFLKKNEGTYKNLADLLIEQGRLPEAQQVLAMLKEEEFFEFIRRDAGNDSRDTTVGYNPAEQVWLDRYNKVGGRVAAIGAELRALKKKHKSMRTDADKKRIKELRADQKVAMKAFNKTITELQVAFAKLKDNHRRTELAKKDVDVSKVGLVRDLGHGAVLLQYIMMEDKLHIIVTTDEVVLARQVKVKSSELNKLIQQFRQALGNPHIDPRPAGKALYAKLIAPVESDLKQAGAKMLMVSLDGALRYIPIAALYDGKQYVAQQYAVAVYTEAATASIALAPKGDWQVAGLGLSRKVKGFNPLPAVAEELNGIVKNGKDDKEGVIPGIVEIDQAFTDEALKDALFDEYRVLHIASHFVFKPGTLEKSFLLLGDGTHLSLAQIQQGDYDLSSVELLTLSACETAVGATGASGNEVEGLGTLAQKKGAKAVLATLWSVADESTGLFMQDLYRTKVATPTMTKAEALRQVQLSFINGGKNSVAGKVNRGAQAMNEQKSSGTPYNVSASAPFAHPYYWAPFILMGNWL